MSYALAFAFGYLLGSIPFGLLLTRAAGAPDIRTIGSGNIGATNVLRTGRKMARGRHALLRHVQGHRRRAHGEALWRRTQRLRRVSALLSVTSSRCGSRFKGGKGVATYIGVLIGLYWPAALAFCVIWLSIAAASPLFITCRIDSERPHAAWPLGFWSARSRGALSLSDRGALVQAPREYCPAAQRHRRQNRREGRPLPTKLKVVFCHNRL